MTYFGAFYYNAVDDLPWYMSDMPSARVAGQVAKTRCEAESRHKGQCRLYAVALPKGFSGTLEETQGLSALAAYG